MGASCHPCLRIDEDIIQYNTIQYRQRDRQRDRQIDKETHRWRDRDREKARGKERGEGRMIRQREAESDKKRQREEIR